MFVSFVRKFTQGLDLSYEQLNALSTAMAGLLARIVGGNEALRKENMFQYRPDSFEQSGITPKLKVSFAEQSFFEHEWRDYYFEKPDNMTTTKRLAFKLINAFTSQFFKDIYS